MPSVPTYGKLFRVFISSTFEDMKAERDALQEYVYPRLRELCATRGNGARFQPIDLRWGVSEKASHQQHTMEICLKEIRRCREVTRRPNFILLLGDRYGWRPLPAEIPVSEMEVIRRALGPDDSLLTRWYSMIDRNAVPAIHCLRSRKGRYEDDEIWSPEVERPLRDLLHGVTQRIPSCLGNPLRYGAAATEQEFSAALQGVINPASCAYAFLRTIDTITPEALLAGGGEKYLDVVEEGDVHKLDSEAHARLIAFKNEVRSILAGNVCEYRATWAGSAPSQDHIGTLPTSLDDCMALRDDPQPPRTLCADVWLQLSEAILEELKADEQQGPVPVEVQVHRSFGDSLCRHFLGRTDALAKIDRYLNGTEPDLLVVSGPPGCGKSALLAEAGRRARAARPDWVHVQRFLGTTVASSDTRELLRLLCRELALAYGWDPAVTPADYPDLVLQFLSRLAAVPPGRPLLLLFDSLDQLEENGTGLGLDWIPAKLPANVRVVLSTVPGRSLEMLQGHARVHRIDLQPLRITSQDSEKLDTSLGDGGMLLERWLAEGHRHLTDDQRNIVLAGFAANGLPLYLRLAFEQARRWSSREPGHLAGNDVPELVRDTLAGLARPESHGRELVSRSLSYLAAARHGLGEEELIDLLSRNREVMQALHRRSPRSPKTAHLPTAVWARFYDDVEPYLAVRSDGGSGLLDYYHGEMSKVVSFPKTICRARQVYESTRSWLTTFASNRIGTAWPPPRRRTDASSPSCRTRPLRRGTRNGWKKRFAIRCFSRPSAVPV
jgi:hypothetical protein